MAIDFRLTSHQRELRLESRKFAADVLGNARGAELLPTPEERFRATKPVYEAMVAAGFLRKCIPIPAGGDNAGLIDMAIMAEEFYSVNASITLTMLGTVLGLLPILLAGTTLCSNNAGRAEDSRGRDRKLAAIVAFDMVGYSRLAGADEERMLARLRALRSDLIDSNGRKARQQYRAEARR